MLCGGKRVRPWGTAAPVAGSRCFAGHGAFVRGRGKFVGTRERESVNSVRRGVLQVQRAAFSCIRFVRLHGPAAARGLVAGEAFSPGVCGKEEGVPLRR